MLLPGRSIVAEDASPHKPIHRAHARAPAGFPGTGRRAARRRRPRSFRVRSVRFP